MKKLTRRLRLPLLGSLLLHAAVLLWLARIQPSTPPRAPGRPVVVEVLERPTRPPPAPKPAPQATRLPKEQAAAQRSFKQPPTPSSPQPGPVAQRPTPPSAVKPDSRLDTPKKVNLNPVPAELPLTASRPEPEEEDEDPLHPRAGSPLGKTVHNAPGEVPSEAQLREREHRRVKANTEGFFKDQLAEARVSKGLPDAYFDAMLGALKQATRHPPPLDMSHAPDVSSYGATLESYGRSGSPYGVGGRPESDDAHDPIGYLAMQQDTGAGAFGSGPPGTVNMAQMLATMRESRSREPGITAVVEFVQDAQGRLLETKLIQQSGDKNFDAWVLQTAPDALHTLPPPPAQGSGIHKEGLRSVWAFTGKRSTLRDVSEYKGGEKAVAGALGVLGTLTGGTQFDETTGHMQVRDPRHPSYAVVVTLLRVY